MKEIARIKAEQFDATRRKKPKKREAHAKKKPLSEHKMTDEEKLDESISCSFPASDPPSSY